MNKIYINILFVILFTCNRNFVAISEKNGIRVITETKFNCPNGYIVGENLGISKFPLSIVKDTCSIDPFKTNKNAPYVYKTYAPSVATIERADSLLALTFGKIGYRQYRGFQTKDGKIIEVHLLDKRFIKQNPNDWFYTFPEYGDPYIPNEASDEKGKTFYFNQKIDSIINKKVIMGIMSDLLSESN